MRALLWLFAGPAAALLVASLIGPLGPLWSACAALGGQAAAYPLWRRVERRRMARVLRRDRHRPGISLLRGRLTGGEAAAQMLLRAVCALLAAAVFLLVTG